MKWYRVVREENSMRGLPLEVAHYDIWADTPTDALDQIGKGKWINGHDGRRPEWRVLRAYRLKRQPGAQHYPGVTPPVRVVLHGFQMKG